MKKKCFVIIIILCFSSQSKSLAIQTNFPKSQKSDRLATPIQSMVPEKQNEIATGFSRGKLTTTDLDTARLLSDQPLKSPMGAVLRSAALPGWGQIYNKKYVKGLFVFSVNGTFAYAIYHYHSEWKDTGNKKFQNRRNLYTWYFGISYLLTLVDAFVDAYLFGFNDAVELAMPLRDQDPGYARMDFFEFEGIEQSIVGFRICIDL